MAEATTSGRDGEVTSAVKISSVPAPEARRPPVMVGEAVAPPVTPVCRTPPERIPRTVPVAMVTVESAAELKRSELIPKFCEKVPE